LAAQEGHGLGAEVFDHSAHQAKLPAGENVIGGAAIRHLQGAYLAITVSDHCVQSHQALEDRLLSRAADHVAGDQEPLQWLVLLKVSHDRFEGRQVAVDIGHNGQAVDWGHSLFYQFFSQTSLSSI